jgi:endonuclease YncB( thermonuclease family)
MKQSLLSRLISSISPKKDGGSDEGYEDEQPSLRRTRLKRLAIVGAVLVGYSLFQFQTTGDVNWPNKLLQNMGADAGKYPTRPEAGWRKAAEAIDTLAAKREGQAPAEFQLTGRVVRIADGDTISVLDDASEQHKIRFYGIDAPEQDQPHGEAARNALVQWIENRNVGVVIIEEDDYGRTVGTVYWNNRNINLALVEEGHAWWYDHHAPLERHLQAAQDDAIANQKGLWANDKPIPPWDWRRGAR